MATAKKKNVELMVAPDGDKEAKAKALEAEEAAARAAAGETTESGNEKAAPIKNDDKSAYKNKKD